MGPRPFGVTLVGILIVLGGIGSILIGILGLFSGESLGWGILAMIVALIVGLIYLLVAKGIFNGNAGSRLIVGIVTVISMIGGLFTLLFSSVSTGLGQIIWALIILVLLYSGKAKTFFA